MVTSQEPALSVSPTSPRVEAATGRRFDLPGLIAFYLVAFILSWAWVIPMAMAGETITQGDGWPTHFPALTGPLIAAFVVTAWRVGRPGIADLTRKMVAWRAGWRPWLAALSPALFLAGGLLAMVVAGEDLPAWNDFGLFSGLPAIGVLGVFLLITVVNGYGEETGWRGYALPHLQRRFHPLGATLILAALWALWHIPYFFVLASYQGLGPAQIVPFILGIGLGAVVLTWIYNRSGGSILLPVVWHGIYNLVGGTAAATGVIGAVVTTLVMVHGGVLIYLELRARRRGEASILAPAGSHSPG
jgi:membrane protease YdiL (CAAX protease family)